MSKQGDNMSKPAFPQKVADISIVPNGCEGMSLLEYYAGQIFGQMYKQFAEVIVLSNKGKAKEDKKNIPWKDIAKYCFDGADAMMKEAEKRSI